MSWDRTCCMSTTSSSSSSSSSSATFALSSLSRDYDIPPPPPPPPLPSSSSFLFLSSSDYIDEQFTREQQQLNSLPPPPPLYNYHPHLYTPIFSSRVNISDTCPCNTSNTYPPYDISSSFQSPFLYEQYLTSLKSEQSDHLPYLFDNIIYPQPCSPPSPINDSITYYQLDQTNSTTPATVINKFPQNHSHTQAIQPITYQQLSLTEPASSNTQPKTPMVKRFYYDSNMLNTTTTTIMTTTPMITNTNDNDHNNLPYARLDSTYFGTYDIWQERTVIGRKSNQREVNLTMDATSVISRIHFELLLINGSEFHLKCHSKNGIFINNTYATMSSVTILPKQCTLRFPSTDLCISFSSLINHNSTSRTSLQSVPNQTKQQVVFVDVNQHAQRILKHESNQNLPPLTINIPNSASSSLSNSSSLSTNSSHNGHIKCQYESPTNHNHSFLGSPCSTSPKNEYQPIVSSPNDTTKTATKPPFSYAQLIVQAILSVPDKQMTLSQIYNFISAQYPYYAANNRGWQNSIRHNLSLNRYFIRLARKENESGKGSFWRLDQTCEDKLIDHAFRHRKHRGNSMNTSNIQQSNDPGDFLLADVHTSNQSTPLSPMASPLTNIMSPVRLVDDNKRKRDDDNEIQDLLNSLVDSIDYYNKTFSADKAIKRQKI